MSGKTTAMYFTCIDQGRNRFRWYLLHLQPDLFGGVNLVRSWGRIGRSGQFRSEHYSHSSTAAAALAVAVRHRRRRGYVIVDS